MADQNILVRITGEADLTEAQVQLRELNEKGKALEADMAKLIAAERLQTTALEHMANAEEKVRQKAEEELKTTQKQIREQQSLINANKKSIQTLNQNISTYKAVGGATTSLRNQIKTLTQQLSQMEAEGDTSSQTFIDMSVQLAKLTDAMGDTQAQIRLLASDTKNLDTALQVGSGLAGAFNAVTSAMALVDGESEELQQAFLKVQAAMAVLNGVQQVATVLDKRSAANIVLRTALQKVFNREKRKETTETVKAAAATGADAVAKGASTAATGAATIATKAWTAALLANPVMWLVVGVAALTAGIMAYNSVISKTGKAEAAAEKARKRLENQTILTTKVLEQYSHFHGKTMLDIERRENHDLEEAKKRHATRLELQQIELKYEKERRDALYKYHTDTAKQYGLEMEALKTAVNRQENLVKSLKKGSDGYYEQVKVLNELKKQWHDTEMEAKGTYDAYLDSFYAAQEKERQIAEERLAIQDKLQQSRLNLMKNGAEKEIAQVKFNYEQQLREVEKGSALYKSMIKERDEAIADIQRQYDLRATAAMVQQYKNESDANANDLEMKKWYYEQDAQYKVMALDKKKMTEEEYQAQVEAINVQLQNNLRDIESKRIDTAKENANDALVVQQNLANEVLSSSKTTFAQALQAQRELKDARDALLQSEFDALDAHYKNGEMTYEEYQRRLEELNHERIMNEIEDENAKAEQMKELQNEILSFVSDMASEIFGAISDHIQQQLDDLDEYYTTDAEEAKENANKKYLSEKEMEDKKLALKRKAAAVEKAEAAFNIAMNTAMAIMRIWADVPKFDFGATTIAMTAMAAALGATQLAMVLAKPLPKYAKGRKGGGGEYAMVGERGAELMYIPDGASIVPHHRLNQPQTWGEYNVPMPRVPAQPDVERAIMQAAIMQQIGIADADFDKFGKAVAQHIIIPEQKAVYVNVDSTGIGVSEGGDSHTYLNRKYQGAWN